MLVKSTYYKDPKAGKVIIRVVDDKSIESWGVGATRDSLRSPFNPTPPRRPSKYLHSNISRMRN